MPMTARYELYDSCCTAPKGLCACAFILAHASPGGWCGIALDLAERRPLGLAQFHVVLVFAPLRRLRCECAV